MNSNQQQATFDGETVEDLAAHIAAEGKNVLVAKEFDGRFTDRVTGGTVISWLTDDNGRPHFAVHDTSGGLEYAATVDEAVEIAVNFAVHVIDPEYPVDVAYDDRIPAKRYGERSDLEVSGLPRP